MDASTNFLLTQLIMVWALFGLLLTWMVIFAVLAIRSHPYETLAQEDLPTPSTPLPAISMLPKLHMITAAETVKAEPSLPSEAVASS